MLLGGHDALACLCADPPRTCVTKPTRDARPRSERSTGKGRDRLMQPMRSTYDSAVCAVASLAILEHGETLLRERYAVKVLIPNSHETRP